MARIQAVLLPRLRPAWAPSSLIVILYVVADFGAVAILDCEVLTWELYKASGSRDAVVIASMTMACVVPLVAGVRILHGRSVDELTVHRAPPFLAAHFPLDARSSRRVFTRWSSAGGAPACPRLGPLGPSGARTSRHIRPSRRLGSLDGALRDPWSHAHCRPRPCPSLAQRKGGRGAAWVSHGVHLTSSLPGVLVGVGLLHLILALKRHLPTPGGELWSGLEALGVFLILAYAMRFLAMAHDALEPVMTRLDPRLSEAARGLGATRSKRLQQIELPQILPGVRAPDPHLPRDR